MSFRVIKPGFSASIQDLGRQGFLASGLSQSGVMDEHSALWANHLLNNAPNSAVLEIPLGHVFLQALNDCEICVTGADCQLTLNQRSIARYQVIQVKQGYLLNWQAPKSNLSGVRSYLAVKGGFQTPSYFGSRSVSIREQLGAPIVTGETLFADTATKTATAQPTRPKFLQSDLPNFNAPLTLRLVEGAQIAEFNSQTIARFYQQTFKISPSFDRTGCRLIAEDPILPPHNQMVSEGMTAGAVQIPPEGSPIIMMKDHPTMGGYPKLGSIFSLDLNKLAQSHPGTDVRFQPISIAEAQQKRRRFNQFFGL